MLQSCGIVPVRVINGVPQYLLLRNRSHWDFPKGRTEEGESHLECALREFREESGIEQVSFDWGIDRYHETEPYSKPKKVARYYVGRVPDQAIVKLAANPKTGIVEHEESGWFGFEDASKFLKPRILAALEFARAIVEKK